MEIVWSPQSLSDLDLIGCYISRDSPSRAASFVEELLLSVNRLLDFPESGSIVEKNPVFRQIVHGNYRLIYQVRLNLLLIVTILGPGQIDKL